jgi:hypothetical protein
MFFTLIDGDVSAFNGRRNAELFRQHRNKFGIGPGFSPSQFMVQMGHVQPYSKFVLQVMDDVKKADRVGPTGDAQEKQFSGFNQLVLADEIQDPFSG